MIRLIFAALLLCGLAFAFAWLVDHPGEIAISWFGQRIETSTVTAIVIGLAMIGAIVAGLRLFGVLWRSPKTLNRRMKARAQEKALAVIARGLVAVGAGDVTAAQKAAREADRLSPQSPLALLLRSQAAQLAGDRETASSSFRAMAARSDTKALGLRGLYVEARREGNHDQARLHAMEALAALPALPWAAHATLGFQAGARDWEGALATIKQQAEQRILSRDKAKRLKAVVLTAKAIDSEASDRLAARQLALEAHHMAPDLVPAAALAARLLAEAGDVGRASRVVETSWRLSPHPDLAEAYAHVRIGDSAHDRIKRAKTLVKLVPGHPEGAFALVGAYMEARDFTAARATLNALSAQPTRRYCLLFAHLAQAEGIEGEAREWFARASQSPGDAAWTADGLVSERWLPVSPVSGDLDAFQWLAPPGNALPPGISLPHVPAAAPIEEAPHAPAGGGVEATADKREAPLTLTMSLPSQAEALAPKPVPKLNFIPDDPGPKGETSDEVPVKSRPGY